MREPNTSYDDLEQDEYFVLLGLQKRKYTADFPVRRALGLACLIFAIVKILQWL